MNAQTRSLLEKEWIKIRRGIWIIPLLLAYAVADSHLVLNTINRMHGPLGLWATILDKSPTFFSSYLLLVPCGVLLAALQAWPECQGKRLRLLFHTPATPERILSVMLLTGTTVLILFNLLALAALTVSMRAHHFPPDVIIPVLLTVAQWCVLSFAAYFSAMAFFGSTGLPMKLVALAGGYAAYTLLADVRGYGLYARSLPVYTAFALAFVPLVYFAFLRFMGDRTTTRFELLRTASLLLISFCLCALLPVNYWRVAMPERVRQSMHYSPVLGEFVLSSTVLGKAIGPLGAGSTVNTLENGTELTRQEHARALPFLYAEDLMKWNTFPPEVAGMAITAQQAKYGWQFLRFRANDWNRPAPMLHMLLESSPEGARLQMAPDLMRLASGGMGLEFIRPEDGQIDEKKSRLFTLALSQAGFAFPVTALGGNPDTRKEYDLGYFLTDSGNTLFQLQMVRGEPRCVNTKQNIPGTVRSIIVQEHRRRDWSAFVVTDADLYALETHSGQLRRFPLERFNANTSRLTLWSDMVSKSAILANMALPEDGEHGIGMTPDYELAHTFTRPPNPDDLAAMEQRRMLASFLFPLQVGQHIPGSAYVHLGVKRADNPALGLASCLISLLLVVLMRRVSRKPCRPGNWILAAVFGPVGLLAIVMADAHFSLPFLKRRGE
ncbi:DUF4857 domain-containing protein [Desulfovibrio psychrotolerans]|uniref:Uncharacterized protein n=1 Tax=Desulfovibrio psychrotolerans TaxID=415242 RepID=A0A7J0BRH7_9BACT|nr:DUF4857 domain-containing protein [Desulfovibrio psychrotolerans]GFM36268.1 hypothetical protein DSM19430T_09520 [Desulfovibrio psychrotolerans]